MPNPWIPKLGKINQLTNSILVYGVPPELGEKYSKKHFQQQLQTNPTTARYVHMWVAEVVTLCTE